MKHTLFILFVISKVTTYAQTSIEEYYKYLSNSKIQHQIELKKLKISYERDKVFRNNSVLYLKANDAVLDSLTFDEGYIQFHEFVKAGDSFNAWYINKGDTQALDVFIHQDRIKSTPILGMDTLYLFEHLYGYNYFIDKNIYMNVESKEYEGQGFKLYRRASREQEIKMLFDFYQLEEIKAYESWSPYIPLVTKLYSVGNNKNILVETGIFDGGLTNLNYFVLNTKTNEIENITQTSNFQKLVSDPKKNLVNYPHYKHLSFEPKIGNDFIVDNSDTLAYFSANFHESDVQWNQDAFVMDQDYKIIGRVLEREITIIGYGINGEEKWYRVRSSTDSILADFNLQLKYPMEKTFHSLYYDSLLDETALINMNKHELSLLKNFIFAKHNYQFKSPFYQAYFNTFTFYNSPKQRNRSAIKVNNLLTAMDKKNLALILEKIKGL